MYILSFTKQRCDALGSLLMDFILMCVKKMFEFCVIEEQLVTPKY